jgi:hypothetical protein
MVVVLVRPDNFIDPSGSQKRLLHVPDLQELLIQAVEAYRLTLPNHVEAQIWSHPLGYKNRCQLKELNTLEHDGMTLYLHLKVNLQQPLSQRLDNT